MTTADQYMVPVTILDDRDPPSAERFTLFRDDEGPTSLITTDAPDERFPVLTVPADIGLAALAESPLLLLLESYPRLPGFVVVDAEGDVLGVLPIEVLDEYLGSGEHDPSPTVMGPGGGSGDVDVPGDPRVPHALIRCRAESCGHLNSLTYLDPARPPTCTNPDLAAHPLAITGA